MSTAPIPNYGLASFKAEGVFAYDSLISGGTIVSRIGTLASGAGFYKRGQIVHIDPATGVVTPGDSAPNGIVSENADATLTTSMVLVYLSGKFKADQIIWPGTGNRNALTDQLRDWGILIESVITPGGYSTQAIAAVTLTPASRNHSNALGGASIAVNQTGPGAWFYTKDASSTWITVNTPDTPQTASGSVTYTVAAQVAAAPQRTGHIYVNGQTYTITQDAGA
jgi:hypothetical protein